MCNGTRSGPRLNRFLYCKDTHNPRVRQTLRRFFARARARNSARPQSVRPSRRQSPRTARPRGRVERVQARPFPHGGRKRPRFARFFCPLRDFLPSGGQLYVRASENAARGRRKSLAQFFLALAPFFLALAQFFRGVRFPGAMCRLWRVSNPCLAVPPSVCPPVPRLRAPRMPVAGAYALRVCVRVRSRLRTPRVSVRVPVRVSVRVRPYAYARALGDECAPVSACARVLHIRAGASRAVHGRLCRHKKAAQPAQKRACAGLCADPSALALKRLARV